MPKLIPTIKNNIRNQFIRMLLSMLFLFSLIVIALYIYIDSSNDKLIKERDAVSGKSQIVRNMDESFNEIFFRARGYYAFKDQDELNLLYDEMDIFEVQLSEFGKLPLSSEEMVLYGELKEFLIAYRDKILPRAVSYVDADDYGALRELSGSGTNDLVNKFISYTKTYNNETDLTLTDLFNRILEQVQFLTVLYISLGIIVILIIGVILRRVIQNLIAPIEKLTTATDAFASGGYVDITDLKKKEDELGLLATSFYNMTLSIQEKEEVLTTQNEELMAQQDELQGNQEQLQQSLSQLEQYNELNHALTFTLEKGKLLDDLHEYLRRIYEFDSSLMYLVDSNEFVSKGLAKETAEKLIRNLEIDKIARLEEEKSFVIRRQIKPNGQNIAQAPYSAYDLYACILNSEKKLVAVLLATREGWDISKQDLLDIDGHMNQASIAFERIFMYEEVERARKLNQSIIDTVNEGIQFVSKMGEVLLLNKALFGIIRYPYYNVENKIPQQIWLKHFQSIVDESEELIYFLKNAIIEEFANTRTMRYSIGNEMPIFVEVYATSVFEGDEKVGTMFVHRDITSEYEVDQMKSELVSTVSHELRTPLSSVLGFTELLLTKEIQPDRQKKYIETIHKEAKRLTNLINDFLGIQRMESGNQLYSMEKIAFVSLAKEVLKNFKFDPSHEVRFVDQSTNSLILADEERLVQLLINLIGNAVKFSPNGGEIMMKVENNQESVKVSIKDKGIGIPENAIPTLFQKFKRVDNSSRRKIGGTGLGLSLCREIISKHNGEIWIESQEGVGTTVFFTLPLYEQNLGRKLDVIPASNSFSDQKTVMIVEDDLSLALLLSEELKSKGFSIIYHDDLKRAFEEAIQTPLVGIVIDLIIGDNIQGWDLVEALRNHEKTRDLPIIISSALDKSKVNMDKYKVERYFTKPYPPEELSKLLLNINGK
ncbi:ATP-binding protein [Solibacillus silvestris]|uniref:ATP-binding protein n=1 Tax=Solibacillus silvestris TaxID=76853 RepID=UPI003F7F0A2D